MIGAAPSARAALAARLRRLSGAGEGELPLAEAALALSLYDRPDGDAAVAQALLQRLNDALAEAAGPGLAALDSQATLLARVVAEDHGFQGDDETYDDLANGCLLSVLERRRGLPVALGILYIAVARAQGWAAAGLGFPGHFLIALSGGGRRVILDPFSGGRRLEAPDLRRLLEAFEGPGAALRPAHHGAVPDRDILLRLRNNLKLRHLQAGRGEAALEVLETMLMIAPERAHLWYETGCLQAESGNLGAALLALDHCAALDTAGAAGRRAEELAQRLKRRLN